MAPDLRHGRRTSRSGHHQPLATTHRTRLLGTTSSCRKPEALVFASKSSPIIQRTEILHLVIVIGQQFEELLPNSRRKPQQTTNSIHRHVEHPTFPRLVGQPPQGLVAVVEEHLQAETTEHLDRSQFHFEKSPNFAFSRLSHNNTALIKLALSPLILPDRVSSITIQVRNLA